MAAARLGWTHHPTMEGPHWVWRPGEIEPAYVIVISVGTGDKEPLIRFGSGVNAVAKAGLRYLKVVPPKPPA